MQCKMRRQTGRAMSVNTDVRTVCGLNQRAMPVQVPQLGPLQQLSIIS